MSKPLNTTLMQECELELTQKGDMVARLQVKASQIGKILQNLENKSQAAAASADGNKTPSSQQQSYYNKGKFADSGPPVKKPHYIDPIPPFNASKIRKSPSGTSAIVPGPCVSETQPVKDVECVVMTADNQ